ncbi:MAG: ImmA/IrrE family metallo-endopeptidase [Alphaproteobacteria bacterium]
MSDNARPAEELLRTLGISAPSEIDVEAIAYSEGAIIKRAFLRGCEARIIGRGDKAIITVSNNTLPTRRRFSAAHELGHWYYHRGRSFVCKSEDIGNPQRLPSDPERVADSYAADLLLPRYLFVPTARNLGAVTYKSIRALADEFSVSLTAAALRLVEIGLEPVMLVCHDARGRRWFSRPANIPNKWFPREKLDEDSYAANVMRGEIEASHRALIGADAWFDRDGAEDLELYEQTFRTFDGQVLTVLTFKDEGMLYD